MEAGNCPCIKLVKVLLKKLQNDLFKVIIRALDNCLQVPFRVENSWFVGEAKLTTYHLEELVGTKVRALYQRKKGRDLLLR